MVQKDARHGPFKYKNRFYFLNKVLTPPAPAVDMQSYSFPSVLLPRDSTTVFPALLLLSWSLDSMQHFSQGLSSPNLMIMESNCGHTINFSTSVVWLREVLWCTMDCRELLTNVLWRQIKERKIINHSLLWNILKDCLCFWRAWIPSWS